MTRKIISAFLALILCGSLVLSVSAEAKAIDFVIDELGCLTNEECSSFNELASSIYEQTGVGIFFTYLQTESVLDYDVDSIVNGIADYVIMLENETHWCLYTGGRGDIIDKAAEELRAIYNATPTYAEGVPAFLEAAAEYFPEKSTVTEEIAYDAEERFLYDDADLLTEEQEAALVQKLENVSHAHNTQLVIATLPALNNGNIDDFVEYLYDSMDFGYGETKDGVLLLVCMDPREYRILSNGHAGVAIGPDQVDTLCDFMDLYLPKGSYAAAFNSFADQCGEMLQYYESGSPFQVGKNLAISLMIGLLVGLIVALILKGQLKSVRKQYAAHVYVKQDSMQVNLQHDIFLYRNVTRTRKQEREKSSSASGSDGTARTKGGGSF